MFRIEGHRGFGIERKENTLDAFSEASYSGLDAVELDVWLTSDLIPVVVHANTELGQCYMNRICDKKKISIFITKTRFSDLKDLTYGISGEPIPTLETAIRTLKNGGISMNAELKDWRPEVVSKTLDIIYELDYQNYAFISSFHHFLRKTLIEEEQLRGIPRLGFGYLCMIVKGCGGIPDWALIEDDLLPDKDLVIVDANFVVAFEMELIEIRDNAMKYGVGLGLYSGFADVYLETDEFFSKCLKFGVKNFITNVPSKIIKYRTNSINNSIQLNQNKIDKFEEISKCETTSILNSTKKYQYTISDEINIDSLFLGQVENLHTNSAGELE